MKLKQVSRSVSALAHQQSFDIDQDEIINYIRSEFDQKIDKLANAQLNFTAFLQDLITLSREANGLLEAHWALGTGCQEGFSTEHYLFVQETEGTAKERRRFSRRATRQVHAIPVTESCTNRSKRINSSCTTIRRHS